MRVGVGDSSYRWIDQWAEIPDSSAARQGWAHHGVAVTEAGDVVTYHPGESTMMVFDQAGTLLRSWPADFTDAHGITLVKEGECEYLWIADNGRKRQPGMGYQYSGGGRRFSGKVVKIALDGQSVMSLEQPDIAAYRTGNYSPTSVAINEQRHGGNGDIWVADGYGESYVHRYGQEGNYMGSINGEEGPAGRFNCPHGIFIDRRKTEAELYVADRANHRVQVYDLNGKFKRVFGADYLSSPSGFVTHNGKLIIAELRARLAVLDIDDSLVCYLGENESVCDVAGWPNNKDTSDAIVPTKLLESGKFNSPHGMAVDSNGNLYVSEWLIGGRFIKLAKG